MRSEVPAPPDWRVVPAGSLAAPEPYSCVGGPFGSDLTSKHYATTGVPVIRGTNLNGRSRWLLEQNFVYVPHSKAVELRRNQAFPGDLVFTQRGTLGQVARIRPDTTTPAFVLSQSQMKLTADPASSDADYLYFYFSSPVALRRIERATIATGLPHINLGILRDFLVPLPPLGEQRKIAAILSSVDDAIESTQTIIDQIQIVKKAMMAELLTRGLPGRHTRFKKTEIGEAPEGWQAGCVGDFLTLQRGYDITEKEVHAGTVPVISSSGVTYHHSEFKCRGPGVVTGRKGKLGSVFYVEGPFWPHDTTLWVSDFKGSDPRFVVWFLRGLDLERLDSATAVPTLNRNNVHPLLAAIPPKDEQIEIATVLEGIVESIDQNQALLGGQRSVKSALMSVLLTGELRVTPEKAAT